MPVELRFPVYQCRCGEIFKKKDNFKNHLERWNHSPMRGMTIVVKVRRPENSVHVQIVEGVAEGGYK